MKLSISVFGSSEPVAGEPLYEDARRIGRLLADAGYRVITGGYGGVMEGASRGAAEAGGDAVGVVCSIFGGRAPNRYLTELRETGDLLERTRMLIELSRGYIVLRGKSGTLAELATVWALKRAGSLRGRPVILLGDDWRHWLRHLVRAEMIEAEQLDETRVVDAPEEAMDALSGLLAASPEG